MRLGTKILILTLAITLALAGIIVWAVTRNLTAHETARAQADIRRAVNEYFKRIESLHQERFGRVTLVMEDPQSGAQLEALDAGDESAREQFKYLFEHVLHRDVWGGRLRREEAPTSRRSGAAAAVGAPSFNLVLNFEGKPLLAFAPGNERLSAALAGEPVDWPFEPLLADEPVLPRKYVWVDGGLYLALGLPLHVEVSGPPTHAYFVGYRIDDAWARSLIGETAMGPGPVSGMPPPPETTGRAIRADAPLVAWFVVDGGVLARGASAADKETDRGVVAAAGTAAVAGSPAPADVRSRIEFNVGDEHFVGESVAFDLPGGRRGALAVASSLTGALAGLRQLQRTIALVTACVLVGAVIAFRFVSNFIARPVRLLVAGTQRVARGEFDEPIIVDRRDELGELAISFNDMAAGLRQRDLVKSTFGRFVDPRIVEGFLADPSHLMPGGDKRVQSVLFSDLVSFTDISERLDADDLVALLNGYLGDAADIVTESRGIVDKFIGDAVVAFWGPPITDDHAALACRAAVRMVGSMARHDEQCHRLGVRSLRVRVGIATGEVLVGIIGSSNKYDYTVLGDTANLGSRLEGLNKAYGTDILVTARTAREASHAVITRRIDRVQVVGRSEPIELYEVLAERGEQPADAIQLRCESFAEAMARYDEGDWEGAAVAFDRICRTWPEDGAARAMATRCGAFQQHGPGADWDGVWVATSK